MHLGDAVLMVLKVVSIPRLWYIEPVEQHAFCFCPSRGKGSRGKNAFISEKVEKSRRRMYTY